MSPVEEDRIRSVLEEMLAQGATPGPPVSPAEVRRRAARYRLPTVDAKLLFAVAAAVVLVIVLVAVGTHHRNPITTATSPPTTRAAHTFSVRPLLCYAPPLAPNHGHPSAAGSLPTCSAASRLTLAHLQVEPRQLGTAQGYSANADLPTDPAFAAYTSTSPAHQSPGATVLLPGLTGLGPHRYVLGPAGLTGSAVQSARARLVDGQWLVDVSLTARGAVAWDALAHEQFHQMIGVDLDGTVITDPLVQPTQTSFSSTNGQLEITGGFPEAQAIAIARTIDAAR